MTLFGGPGQTVLVIRSGPGPSLGPCVDSQGTLFSSPGQAVLVVHRRRGLSEGVFGAQL